MVNIINILRKMYENILFILRLEEKKMLDIFNRNLLLYFYLVM